MAQQLEFFGRAAKRTNRVGVNTGVNKTRFLQIRVGANTRLNCHRGAPGGKCGVATPVAVVAERGCPLSTPPQGCRYVANDAHGSRFATGRSHNKKLLRPTGVGKITPPLGDMVPAIMMTLGNMRERRVPRTPWTCSKP